MGFTYDHFITQAQYDEIPEESRSKVMMSAIVLSDMQVKRYSDRLTQLDDIDYYMSYNTFTEYAEERAGAASSSFKVASGGFTCEIKLRHNDLVFFSVPYDAGWTAYVNGVETAIEKVNVGFMAVPAGRGDNVIEFRYETPGLKTGLMISGGTLVVAAAYVAARSYKRRRTGGKLTESCIEAESPPKPSALLWRFRGGDLPDPPAGGCAAAKKRGPPRRKYTGALTQ